MSEVELRLWDGDEKIALMHGSSTRPVWRLFSPSFRLIACDVARNTSEFELRVTAGDEVLASLRAPDLEALHAHAAEWRTQLEQHGYAPADGVRVSEPRPAGRSSEARAAFKGLVECAALLELRHAEAGRRLRELATEGLVGVGLGDADLMRDVITESRAALDAAASVADPDLIKSCRALLDRALAELPGGGV
jgi:hypothetical protein